MRAHYKAGILVTLLGGFGIGLVLGRPNPSFATDRGVSPPSPIAQQFGDGGYFGPDVSVTIDAPVIARR